jgi:hypothetical protein
MKYAQVPPVFCSTGKGSTAGTGGSKGRKVSSRSHKRIRFPKFEDAAPQVDKGSERVHPQADEKG